MEVTHPVRTYPSPFSRAIDASRAELWPYVIARVGTGRRADPGSNADRAREEAERASERGEW